jgi:hypothetical protein
MAANLSAISSRSPSELAKALLERWQNDPARYAKEALGTTTWSKQREILEAVRDHPRVAVRSGHKIGKSRTAAILAHWWVATRPGAIVVMTSASARQVKTILWKEFTDLFQQAPFRLGPTPALDPGTGYRLVDGRVVSGFSTDKPERMAGISGVNLLFILDEASGIDQAIFEAIEGNRAGGARVVMFSNPTQTSGEFFEAFHSKANFYKCIHVSSADTPNVKLGKVVIPGLATAEWLKEKLEEWGEDSPLFHVRVKGDFAGQSEDSVVPLFLVEKAHLNHDPDAAPEGELSVGVDVARFGDDECIARAVRGLAAGKQLAMQSMDGPDVAAKVLEWIKPQRIGAEKVTCNIDVIGVGSSAYDAMRRFPEAHPKTGWLKVVAVNVSNRATANDFSLLRDQLWFGITEWIKAGGTLPPDGKLDAELVAPKYGFDTRGNRKVESKDEIKKRLKRSPDRADALALAIYRAPVRTQPGTPPPIITTDFDSATLG